jgi:hypothetical protein
MGVFMNLSSFKSREYSMIQDQYDAYINLEQRSTIGSGSGGQE